MGSNPIKLHMFSQMKLQNNFTTQTQISITVLRTLVSYVATLVLGNTLIIVANSYFPFIPKSIIYLIDPEVINLEHENIKMKHSLDILEDQSSFYDDSSSQENNFINYKKHILAILSIIAGIMFTLMFFGYMPTPTLAYLQEQLTNLIQNLGASDHLRHNNSITQLGDSITTVNTNLNSVNLSQQEVLKCLKGISSILTSYIAKQSGWDPYDSNDSTTKESELFGGNSEIFKN